MGQSWSHIRKLLEQEYLCDSLKGHIQYFVTRYPRLSDVHTRVAIRLDGKEILKSDFVHWRRAPPHRFCVPGDEIETHNHGGFDSVEFTRAFYVYQNQNVQRSIRSEDPLIRLFAILDRRLGKRTLRGLIPTISSQPDWLRVFYTLRLKADGILPDKEQDGHPDEKHTPVS